MLYGANDFSVAFSLWAMAPALTLPQEPTKAKYREMESFIFHFQSCLYNHIWHKEKKIEQAATLGWPISTKALTPALTGYISKLAALARTPIGLTH